MRIRIPTLLVAPAMLFLAGACSIDDNSSEVIVEVTGTAPVVVRGDKLGLQARAFRVVGVDTVDIKNIRFAWTSSDRTIATVEGDDFGGAEVTGVNPGLIDISATAVAFEQSGVGTMPLRVSNFLEVDSVRPRNVKWGEKVALYGVGVRNVLIADLGTGLFPDTLTFQGDPQGLGRMEFWVPPPARSAQLFGLGPGVFFTVPETTTVDTVDLYEYNDTVVRLLTLDGPKPYPTLPQVLFFDPALAFEEPPRDTSGLGITKQRFDWYRFARADTTKPLTIILKPAGLADSSNLFIVLSDSIIFSGGHGPGLNPTWFITSEGGDFCNSKLASTPQGQGGLFVNQSRRDSTILQFKRLPGYGGSRGFHVLAFYAEPQRYALTFLEGFQPTDPRIGQDHFEENDLCSFADSNFSLPATQIVLNAAGFFLPFLDSSLTIDTPHEHDWYRFRLTAAAAESVTFKIRSRPFGSGPLILDRSDIDFYVVRASDFSQMGSVSSIGSRDSLKLLLAPGDYYFVAVDFAGEVTRYSVCIRPRFTCTPLTSAVEANAVVATKTRHKGDRSPPSNARSADAMAPGTPLRAFRRP